MFQLVHPIGELLKIKRLYTSDIYFVLNTKLTVVLLLLFSVLLSAQELFGTKIDCYTEDNDKKKSILDNYCWTVGTFINQDVYAPESIGKSKATFGVSSSDYSKPKIYQKYYQWIALALIIQATIAYIPAYLWKVAEGGLLSKLCDKLDSSFGGDDWLKKKAEILKYFNREYVSREHIKYVYRYMGCKLMSLLFMLLNMYMIGLIIPGFWKIYAKATVALLSGDYPEWSTCSSLLFPKQAKCMYANFGPSGTIQSFDTLCLLPLNILNEKIFVIIWIWYIALFIISSINFIYLLVICNSKSIRISLLRYRSMLSTSRKQMLQITNNANLGDYFVMNQIAKNVNCPTFVDLMTELSQRSVQTHPFNFNLNEKSTPT